MARTIFRENSKIVKDQRNLIINISVKNIFPIVGTEHFFMNILQVNAISDMNDISKHTCSLYQCQSS